MKKVMRPLIPGLAVLAVVGLMGPLAAQAQPTKPNILVIFGDDIGQTNISAYSLGVMGYRTPNIDRIAREGMIFTDYYAEQSCTAGRSTFITGQATLRTGLSKVGIPGATVGLQARDATIAELLRPLGYATGQFGKNHLGDRNEYLPTAHGFDEFFGNLYHLNAEEDPEDFNYPRDQKFNQLPYLTGQQPHSARQEFFYFNDDGDLVGLRYENWKVVFMEQRAPGTLQVWAEPFVALRLPKLFNLRADPYERADVTSNTYWDWVAYKGYIALAASAVVGRFLETFKEFPPSQRPATFTIDQAMEKLRQNITGH